MSTGACGIDCDVCRLNRQGVCSTCGAGTSAEAQCKLAVQERLLGAPCPILACARLSGVDYCLRDCETFPCENFSSGPYPFSSGYLQMQRRRRVEKPIVRMSPDAAVTVPPEYWADLAEKPLAAVAAAAGAVYEPPNGLIVAFLNKDIRVDAAHRCIQRRTENGWEETPDPLLALVLLAYLLTVSADGLTGEMVGVNDLTCAHFFQGPHALRIDHLLRHYGRDPGAFLAAGEYLGGEPVNRGADAAIRFMALPKVPLYFLLWAADDEFPAAMSVLFDRSIDRHLKSDAIWGLVTLVSDALAAAV
ncbi:MAG: DUF3786 domain-containing protein [Pseudomonadota bacterium]